MRVNRVFVEQPLQVGATARLGEAAAGHLLRVLRARVGDACVLFNGDGNDYDARITSIGKRDAVAGIDAARRVDRESPLRIVLLQALARGEKMDLILQKGTELGVAGIVPVSSDRSEVRLDAERVDRRALHWRNVVVAACEQSGRARVPSIALPASLAQALPGLPSTARRVLLDPDADQALGDLVVQGDGTVVLAIGPEGGWSPRDRDTLRAAGFESGRLGPRILRTETAGLAAIAVLQSRHGDLG